MNLIPTSSRFRLPKDLAFPTGAEAISQALQGVPQYDALSLCFFSSRFQNSIPNRTDDAGFIEILHATSGPHLGVVDWKADTYGRSWSIYVYPVLRTDKRAVRDALLSHGLARVREWLETPRDDVWRHGHKAFVVSVRPTDGSVQCAETGRVA